MWHLLKIEWLKIRKYRAFLLLFGFFVVSLFGLNYIIYGLSGFARSGKMTVPEGSAAIPDMTTMLIGRPFGFPEVWQTVTYLSSFLLFIPGLMIILLMANEFTFRTHRQNIIDGLSRSQFVRAKIGLIIVLSVFLTLLVFAAGYLFGSAEGASFSLLNIQYVSYFFIQSIAYMSMALVLVMLFRRSGISIGLYFLYSFIVENLLSALVNRYIVSGAGGYLPLESADKLIPAPSILGKVMNPEPVDPVPYLIVSVLWIAGMLWFSHYRFRKMDL